MRLFYCVAVCLFLIGCSGGTQELVDARQLAADNYDQANTAFQQKDYNSALTKYTDAIESGGMYLDNRITAVIRRAVCRAALGDASQAQKELDELREQGGVDSAMFHSAMSYVFSKQGKKKEASLAMRYAKKRNRKVLTYSD